MLDIFSENNAEQHQKWLQFKDRNLLRKLDMALNCVPESEEQIKSAKNEDLLKFADAAQLRQRLPMEKKDYKISIPAVDEEFPELGTTKTLIYPLSISHENQCTLLVWQAIWIDLVLNLVSSAIRTQSTCQKRMWEKNLHWKKLMNGLLSLKVSRNIKNNKPSTRTC